MRSILLHNTKRKTGHSKNKKEKKTKSIITSTRTIAENHTSKENNKKKEDIYICN